VVYGEEGVPWVPYALCCALWRKGGRSTMGAICTVQCIVEKRRKPNLPTFLLFITYGKAFGNVNQGNTWQV
jgi:hypothetical protein